MGDVVGAAYRLSKREVPSIGFLPLPDRLPRQEVEAWHLWRDEVLENYNREQQRYLDRKAGNAISAVLEDVTRH